MDALYACLFSNGHIKVGRSVDPQTRIKQHADRVACMGVTLTASRQFPCALKLALAETRLIFMCEAEATTRHLNEWFVGLDFERVCAFAEEAIEGAPKDQAVLNIEEPSFVAVMRALKLRGYTQADLARICGISQSSISDLATGATKQPSYSVGAALFELAQPTHSSVEDADPVSPL